MVAASAVLGLPHPPGYPLFTLLGRLALLVPVGSPAFRLNLLSGLFVMLSVALIARLAFRLLRGWGQGDGPLAAMLAAGVALSVFSASNVFAQGLTAKGGVYTSTLLLLTVLLTLGERAREGDRHPGRLTMAWLFLWALGMAHHWPTTFLWIPLLAWGGWSGWKGGLKRAASAASVILLGLSVYLYLPIRASQSPTLDWGHPAGWGEFLWTVTRRLTEGTEPWIRPWGEYAAHAREVARVFYADAWPGWILLALLGGILLWRARRPQAIPWMLAALTVPVAVVVVPRPETTYLLNVYLVCCAAPLTLLSLAGFLRLLPTGRARALRAFLAAAFLLAPLLWTVRTWGREDRSRDFMQEDHGVHLLRALPTGAFLVAEGDANVFPLWYQRLARGMRPDVGMTPFVFLHHDWGWSDVVRQRPHWGSRRPGNLVDRLSLLRAHAYEGQEKAPFPGDQELFYTLDTAVLDALVPSFRGILRPYGLLYAVTGRVPDPAFLSRHMDAQDASWRIRGEPPRPGDVMGWGIQRRYADAHVRMADLLYRDGFRGGALSHLDRAVRLYPGDARVYGNMAVIVGQDGWWELSREIARDGVAAVPTSPVLHLNLGNACLVAGDYEGAFSAYAQALRLRPGWKDAQDQLEAVLRMKQGGFRSEPPPRSDAEYRALARSLEAQGCLYLASRVDRLRTRP
jgi:hypothetical protein